MRDIGGRMGLGGRRVRQGRIYRSAGLNSNATKAKDGTMKPGKERLNDAARKYARKRNKRLAACPTWARPHKRSAVGPSLFTCTPLGVLGVHSLAAYVYTP